MKFDETPIFYDTIPTTTYEQVGLKQVNITTGNMHKKRLTLGVGLASSGEKLKPIIIFQGKEDSAFRNLKNYDQMLLRKNQNAWMNEKFFLEWIQKELIQNVKRMRQLLGKPEAKALFIVDCFSGHFGNSLDLCAQNNIDIIFIPPNTTSLAQPLDLTLNKKIKTLLQKDWLDWYMAQNIISEEEFKSTPK